MNSLLCTAPARAAQRATLYRAAARISPVRAIPGRRAPQTTATTGGPRALPDPLRRERAGAPAPPRTEPASRRTSNRGRPVRSRRSGSSPASIAPIGKPLASALAIVTTSGTHAERLERKQSGRGGPMPHCTSSNIEQRAALVAQPPRRSQKRTLGDVHAALALHRFDDERRDRVVDRAIQRGSIVERRERETARQRSESFAICALAVAASAPSVRP